MTVDIAPSTDAPLTWFARALTALRGRSRAALPALNAVLQEGQQALGEDGLLAALRDAVAVEEHRCTLLGAAVLTHQEPLVRRLLEISPLLARDADVQGQTPLMLAARTPDLNLVDLLLPLSDLMAGDELTGDTVLHRAVAQGNLDLLDRMLPFVPDDELRTLATGDGWTLLMTAAVHRSAGMLERLLPLSDPLARDHRGRSAMMLAASVGQYENLRTLLPWSDPHAVDALDRSTLDQMMDMAGSMRLMPGQWRCLDLIVLVDPHTQGFKVQRLIESTPDFHGRDMPLRQNPEAADAMLRAINQERETRVLREALAGESLWWTEDRARPRRRL